MHHPMLNACQLKKSTKSSRSCYVVWNLLIETGTNPFEIKNRYKGWNCVKRCDKKKGAKAHTTPEYSSTHIHTLNEWMIRWLWWRPLWASRQGVHAEKKDWEHELVCHQTLGSKEMFFFMQVSWPNSCLELF